MDSLLVEELENQFEKWFSSSTVKGWKEDQAPGKLAGIVLDTIRRKGSVTLTPEAFKKLRGCE